MTEEAQEPVHEVRAGPFVSASAPALGRIHNEDATGTFKDHTAWVLDGADDPLADTTKCPHGAYWYAHSLNRAIAQSLPEDEPSLDLLLHRAIQRVRDAHQAECEDPWHRKPSSTVAILRFDSGSLEYLVLGDASILLESSDAVIHVTDRRMHQIARDIRHAILDRLQRGHGFDDPQRPALLRELVTQEQRARNTATGYPIAAYDPTAAFNSISGRLAIDASSSSIGCAVLLTDGAERALLPFGLYQDWRHFIKSVSEEGPARSIEKTREAELLDSSGQNFPRTKASDDASIVVWRSWTPLPA
jgi:Protein phosphatase 2C